MRVAVGIGVAVAVGVAVGLGVGGGVAVGGGSASPQAATSNAGKIRTKNHGRGARMPRILTSTLRKSKLSVMWKDVSLHDNVPPLYANAERCLPHRTLDPLHLAVHRICGVLGLEAVGMDVDYHLLSSSRAS